MKKFLKVNVIQNGQQVTVWLSLDLIGSAEKSGNLHTLRLITGSTLMITAEDFQQFEKLQAAA